ncbi:MAG: tetratricopeptide repeat protein [Candidatus Altiarchaeota archaeon]
MDVLDKINRTIKKSIADYYFNKGMRKAALEYYLRCLEISIRLKDQPNIALAHDRVGDCYESLRHNKKEDMARDHTKAGEHYLKSAREFIKMRQLEKAGEIFEKAAKTLEELNEYEKAAQIYLRASDMFVEEGDNFSASFAQHKAAEYYEKNEQYENAAKAYLDTTLLYMRIKDTSKASIAFKAAAKNFEKEKMWQNAVDAYSDAVEIDTLARKYLNVADSYESIARVYTILEDSRNSIYYHLKAAEIRYSNKELDGSAASYRDAGDIYFKDEDYEKSIEYYRKSADIFTKAKNHLQAATSFIRTAESYSKTGEHKKAGKYFIEASKSAEAGENVKILADGYTKAAESYSKFAEECIEKNDFDEAAKSLLTTASCFENIKDYEMSAEKYLEYAELMWNIDEKEKALEGYRNAAEEYIKSGRLWDAGESFYYTQDYSRSADIFMKYSQEMEAKKDYYAAATGYYHVAVAQRSMNNNVMMKQYFLRAISQITKYLESFTQPPDKGDELVSYGDARRMLGESHQAVMELRDAEKQYKKALEIYEKVGDKQRITVAKALLRKMEAEHAIDHGYYPKASTMLEESKELLEASIREGNWKRIYADYLERNLKEVVNMIEVIKMKPKVVLDVDQRTYTFPDIPLILNFKLTNTGQHPMKEISFLEHLPEDIKLTRLPEVIQELEANGVRRGSIELTPTQTGFYRLRPLEVYYEDQESHKYVKACNEMSVEVVERPGQDYKSHRTAVETFIKYAKSQEANENWFQAGDGYREAAETYGRFNSDDTLRDHYTNAAKSYYKYWEENKDLTEEDPTKLKRLGDSLWFAGEAYRNIGKLDDAIKSYEASKRYYNACRMHFLANRSESFKLKTDGIRSVKYGDYEKAEKQFNDALEFLNDVVKSSGFTIEEIKYLEKNEDEIKSMITTIKEKPEIYVSVTGPLNASPNEVITYRAAITNPQEYMVKAVRAMVTPAEGVDVVRKPELIPSIKAGETIEVEFQVKPVRTGEYHFNPLDVTYRDNKNNSFMKGSNEVSLNVSGEGITPEISGEGGEGRDVILNVDQYSYILKNTRLVLNAEIINNTGDKIQEVNFLTNVPPDIRVESSPKRMLELEDKGSRKVSLEVTPTISGEFRVRPLEVFYKDPAGHKYVRASNEVTMDVVETPETDYKNYHMAVEVFIKYARSQEDNKNWFQAGDGYMQAAETYGRFNSDERVRELYRRAIENYGKFVDENKDEKLEDYVKIKRMADGLWHASICEMNIGENKDAVKKLEKSLEYYDQAGLEDMRDIIGGVMHDIKGKIQLEQGMHENAEKELEESMTLLKKVIKAGGIELSLMNLLERTRSEVELMIENLKTKPDVILKVDIPDKVSVGETFVINATISNMSSSPVLRILVEPTLPKEFKLIRTTDEIKSIEPGKSSKAITELKCIKEGEYSFIPFSIKYMDQNNRNYMKGSGEVSIAVVSGEAVEEGKAKTEEEDEGVSITVKQPGTAIIGKPLTLRVSVVNNSKQKVNGLRFIGNPSEGFERGESPPPMDEIEPGVIEKFEYVFTPREKGEFNVKPLEMFYRDIHGTRFFKSSNEVRINVVAEGEKVDEGKTEGGLKVGLTYIIMDDERYAAVRLFQKQLDEGYSGIYVTRSNPAHIKSQYNLEKTRYIWLSDVKTGVEYKCVSDPQELSDILTNFIESDERSMILLEGIEYLIDTVGFSITREFIQFIRDKVSTSDAIMVIRASPAAIDPKQLKKLEHECILYGK